MSRARRQQLQQQLDQARRLAAEDKLAEAGQSLTELVVADPGNLLYVDIWLRHLQAHGGLPGDWIGLGRWRAWKRAVAAGEPSEILRIGAERLSRSPRDVGLLRTLAEACAACQFDEVELRYLQQARGILADDPELNRHCAHALTRQGRFDEAQACWRRVLSALPEDREARELLAELTGRNTDDEAGCAARIAEQEHLLEREPEILEHYAQLARLWQESGRHEVAEEVWQRALSRFGGDPSVRERLEDASLGKLRAHWEAAERRASRLQSEQARQLAEAMRASLVRSELDVFQSRSQRYPHDSRLRFEVARRLKWLGRFREAAEMLADGGAFVELSLAASAALERGECLQQTHRFEEALESYRQVVRRLDEAGAEARDSVPPEIGCRALYRAGVLAEAMRQPEVAAACLRRLLATNPDYKDARGRLDKLSEIDHKL